MSPARPAPVIAVVGSLNMDLVAYATRVPNAGETVIGQRFQMGFGGKGANQAVMAARLGGRVSMVGALGDDVYAGMTFENLERQRVDARHVARVEGSSGVAPIWVEPDGTNRIIVVPGANDRVDPESAAAAVRSLDGRPCGRRPARDPAAGDDCGLPGRSRARRDHDPQPCAGGRARRRPPRRRRLADPQRVRVRDPRRRRVVRPG